MFKKTGKGQSLGVVAQPAVVKSSEVVVEEKKPTVPVVKEQSEKN